MEDKTSTGWNIYQESCSNFGRGLDRGHGKLYGRGQGRGFNPTKPKVWGKCEALGSDVYSIRDARQAEKYTKMTEATLNYIQVNFNKGKNAKETLEELENFD